MIIAIERTVVRRLGRAMTHEERERILRPRALIGYEAILDYLKDESKSAEELKHYLRTIE